MTNCRIFVASRGARMRCEVVCLRLAACSWCWCCIYNALHEMRPSAGKVMAALCDVWFHTTKGRTASSFHTFMRAQRSIVCDYAMRWFWDIRCCIYRAFINHSLSLASGCYVLLSRCTFVQDSVIHKLQYPTNNKFSLYDIFSLRLSHFPISSV